MKLQISTIKLNAMLARISKGVGNIRVLPITEYILIEMKDGELSLQTTDTINFMTYMEKGYESKDGKAVVKANQLIRLVQQTTKSEINLELKETHLQVIGNGTYKLEVNTEDEFPSYEFNKDDKGIEINTEKLKVIFKVNSSAIAEDMLMPCLTGYNLGKLSTTTDGVKMCINNIGIDIEGGLLVSQKQAELIAGLNSESVMIYKDGKKLLIASPNVEIFGVEMDDKKEYPDITSFSTLKGDNIVQVKRERLLDALNRLSIFADIFENGGVTLNFTADNLEMWDTKENSKEEVTYVDSSITEQDAITVSVKYLIELLQVLTSEEIEIQYNADNETPLIIKDGEIVQLLSIMEKSE